MTDASCNLCGKTTDLMQCKTCKSVLYCTRECQVQDWPEHKTLCKRKEFAGAPCDVCHDSEQVIVEVCAECGFIFCRGCDKKMILRNDKGEKIGCGSCPSCEKPMMCMRRHDQDKKEKLENIIQERKGDTREAQWLVRLGYLYQQGEVNEPMAKQCYLRAGELGLGKAIVVLLKCT
jgi:MYND finger